MPAIPDRVILPDDVIRVLSAGPGIEQVALTGSRASGQARPESDWDFAISAAAFSGVRDAMPQFVAPLRPVVAQWDRLSHSWCYMLILNGPAKVDLIFGEPHTPLPPWQVSAGALPGLDDHFWDWMLWLHSKHAAGRSAVVAGELGKLHEHLLGPLGVTETPTRLGQAIAAYRTARDHSEQQFGIRVPRTAERTVTQGFFRRQIPCLRRTADDDRGSNCRCHPMARYPGEGQHGGMAMVGVHRVGRGSRIARTLGPMVRDLAA